MNVLRAMTQEKLAYALSDGKPKSAKELTVELRLNSDIVESALGRMWRGFRVLRSAKPVVCYDSAFRGRLEMVSNVRQYYNYLLVSEGVKSVFLCGQEYVAYSRKFLDKRGGMGDKSKAQIIRRFLSENCDKAYFSKGVAVALKDKGVVVSDVMATVRRLERRGLVYVRVYRSHDKQTLLRRVFW